MLTLLAFLLMVTVLVAAHEFGHYIVAKSFGMQVEEFSIGMGPKIWTYAKRNGTEFTVRPFPIGGFVRVAGMVPDEEGTETAVKDGFYSKGPWPRIWMLLAGPVFSVLAGFVLLLPLWAAIGQPKAIQTPVIGGINPTGAAAKAGLKLGDRVVSVDGLPVNKFFDIIRTVRDNGGKPVVINYTREGVAGKATVTPVVDKEPTNVVSPDLEVTPEKRIQSKIGIGFSVERVPMGLGDASIAAFKRPFEMAGDLLKRLASPKQLIESVGGPESMVRVTHMAVTDGFYSYVEYAGLISMSLAIMNLLPIVPLDGGQIMIAVVELVRKGRRLSFKTQNVVQSLGLCFVLLMFISFITIDRIRWSQIDSESKDAPKIERTK